MIPISWSQNEPPFEAALRFTLWAEGGMSNDPADHGGMTNRGITQSTYSAWRFARKLQMQPVGMLTDDEVHAIYQSEYWMAGTCQPMPVKLAIAHFDWCVNHGPAGAKRTLQTVLGVTVDGSIGSATLEAIHAQDVHELVAAYIQARRDWYHDDVERDPTQGRFLSGWLNRCDRLAEYIG